VLTLEQFCEKQATRDRLALQFVEFPEKYQAFFSILNIKEDKLLNHAVAGELREKAQVYAQESDLAKKATHAQELKKLLTHPNDYRIFKEHGLDPKQLDRDIGAYERAKNVEASLTPTSETPRVPQLSKPLQFNPEDIKARAALLNTLSDLHMRSKPLEGTPAESYVRQGLKLEGNFSPDIRYLPKSTAFLDQSERKSLTHTCLIAFERNQKGKLCGAQLTQLTENGRAVLDAEGQKRQHIQYGVVTKSLQDYVKPVLEPNVNKPYQDPSQNQSKLQIQPSTQLSRTNVSSANNSNNLDTIAKYIEDKIKEIKAYQGTSLAREAKEELRSYLETFQKDERMLQNFRDHCPYLVKDIQRLFQKQQQQIHEQMVQRGKGMDM